MTWRRIQQLHTPVHIQHDQISRLTVLHLGVISQWLCAHDEETAPAASAQTERKRSVDWQAETDTEMRSTDLHKIRESLRAR